MIKPILFNTEMVRAILSGRKKVTRRVQKYPRCGYFDYEPPRGVKSPYDPGDVLWVREAFAPMYPDDISMHVVGYMYKADEGMSIEEYDARYPNGVAYRWEGRWKLSIHMPREAARIWLRVTDMRMERLQEIGLFDVWDEGTPQMPGNNDPDGAVNHDDFAYYWNSITRESELALYGWDANPWVWVIRFERISEDEERNRHAGKIREEL